LHRCIDGLETNPIEYEVRGGVVAHRDHQEEKVRERELQAGVEVAKDATTGDPILVAQAVLVPKGEPPAFNLAVGLDHDRHLDGASRPEAAIAVMGEELPLGPVDRDPNHASRSLGVADQCLDGSPIPAHGAGRGLLSG
jgi:hypothetical protein